MAQIRWVPINQVVANDYNPNSVPPRELELLRISIMADGYTQPVVTVRDKKLKRYVIVDGYHRWHCLLAFDDVRASTGGKIPIVVIESDLAERMASTVRHNRARGRHSVGGMGKLVLEMLELGMTDEEVCGELGLSADEMVRLKYVTGFAKLFEDVEYRRAWKTKRQVEIRRRYKQEHPDEAKDVDAAPVEV